MLANTTALEEQATKKRALHIEFLFLDLTTCTRCVGTDENLHAALDEVQHLLELTNTDVQVEKILIETEKQAQAHRFVTSPTIRVNGRDIALETKESPCDSCTDLCGCEEGTNCRVWLYQGEEYTEAPVGLIIEAILQEVYASKPTLAQHDETAETVPENLKRFFAGAADSSPGSDSSAEREAASACCSSEKQKSCCEPGDKEACRGETNESGSCGCL